MQNEEIRNMIEYWNNIIETNMKHNQFVLNPIVSSALKEIAELQKQCNHEFENNSCKWCGKGENE